VRRRPARRIHVAVTVLLAVAITVVVDAGPGDITGQGLRQFDARWYVLGPGGNKIDND
jgi:hypothetical protein